MAARQFSKIASVFSVGMMKLTRGKLSLGTAIISDVQVVEMKRRRAFQAGTGSFKIADVNNIAGGLVADWREFARKSIVMTRLESVVADFLMQGYFVKNHKVRRKQMIPPTKHN